MSIPKLSNNTSQILPIILYPSRMLTTKAEPIKEVTSEIRALAENMLATMEEAQGIGLAANQVGVLKKIAVVNITDLPAENSVKMPLVLINPEITYSSEELFSYREGCLSIPNVYAEVKRPKHIIVRYVDLEGNKAEIMAQDLLATCLQHEIDHLDGILFINRISALKRSMILKKYQKSKKE